MVSGSSPTKLLKLISNTVTLSKSIISCIKELVNPQLMMTIIKDILHFGQILWKTTTLDVIICDYTLTEAIQLSKFGDKENWNLLLLVKRASSWRSKFCEGMSPLNLLNLMSKYFNEDMLIATEGKGLENKFALIYNSCGRWRLLTRWRLLSAPQ